MNRDRVSSFCQRYAKKIRSIRYKGSICSVCNMNLIDKPWCADFHHINKTEKEFYPSSLMVLKDWEFTKKELDKCMLLCSNCHRDIHVNRELYFGNIKQILDWSIDGAMDFLNNRKATKAEKTRSKELFESGLSYEKIAEIMKFKNNTIRGWCPLGKKFQVNSIENENKIIDLYENKKYTIKEMCVILHCSFRILKRKIIALVEDGRISEYRKNHSNQHIKLPKKIKIDNIVYSNIAEASRILSIPYSSLKQRILSKKWENYCYLD